MNSERKLTRYPKHMAIDETNNRDRYDSLLKAVPAPSFLIPIPAVTSGIQLDHVFPAP